ncbi:MAG: GAF domain-containing protein [Bacillota bacterium]
MNKEGSYQNIIKILEGLVKDESNLIANLSNTAAVLYNNLADINWAGFYLRQGDELVLGPFQGKNACIRISKGAGVCGTAFATQEIQLVDDVHQFAGHIACDPASNSEIVLPIIIAGEVEAVLDIDSPTKGRFDQVDQKYLEAVIQILKKDFS